MIGAKKLRQRGFTIIELMIATAVLSTILVTVTIVMISIGNLYYKGVNQARVQDAARSISEEISQKLELTSQSPLPAAPAPNGTQAYCIGTTRYTYMTGVQITTRGPGTPPPSILPFQHILWRDTIHSADNCLVATLTAADPSANSDFGGTSGTEGAELIPPNSRLISFSISPLTSPYVFTVGVAYGDDDLLCSPSKPGSCSVSTQMTDYGDYIHGDLLCKSLKGEQFCSISSLNTTVVKRLTAH